jgi:hypothetical protein
MLPLDDPRWTTYVGGYQVVYDASRFLRRLLEDEASDEELDEFGNELCHQGDLGSASYASVPWLVEYLRRCPELDARVGGLILTIEFARPFNRDQMPDELRSGYDDSLRRFPDIVLSKRCGRWDDRQVQVAAAVLALEQGNRWFARTYFELDRALLDEMIQKEFGSADWNWPA